MSTSQSPIFKDDEPQSLDIATYKNHILFMAKAGIHGFVCQGSTAEAVALTYEERSIITRATREVLDENGFPDTPIIVGASGQSTNEAVRFATQAKEAGGDYILSLPPSYYASNMTTEALEAFYLELADRSPIPVLVYSYPGVASGLELSSLSIARLAKHKNIVGIKQTDHSVGKMARITHQNPGFCVFGGATDYLIGALAVGVHGAITGLGNVFPKACVHLYNAYFSATASQSLSLSDALVKYNMVEPSLATLPLELVFIVMELGDMGICEALALRQTCRRMYQASRHRLFWVAIAKRYHRRRALPLPPFRTLDKLSPDDLRNVCIRHHQITENLASPKPQIREGRVVVMQKEPSPINHFAFLPGGRHALVMHESGAVHLWDFQKPRKNSGIPRGTMEKVLEDLAYQPKLVGKSLSKYQLPYPADNFDFYTCGDAERTVIMATVSDLPDGDSAVYVLSFQFDDQGDRALVELLCSTRVHFGELLPSLTVCGDLIVLHGFTGMHDHALILLLDYRRSRMIMLNTEVPSRVSRLVPSVKLQSTSPSLQYDSIVDAVYFDDNIIIYGSHGKVMNFHVIRDVASLFHSGNVYNVSTELIPTLQPLVPITRRPDISEDVKFTPESVFNRCHDWLTFHPWNMPSARTGNLLPVTTVSTNRNPDNMSSFDYPGALRVAHHWLDIRHVIHHLEMRSASLNASPSSDCSQASTIADNDPNDDFTLPRCSYFLDDRMAESPDGTELLVMGTSGANIAWISSPNQGKMKLNFLLVPSADESPEKQSGRLNEEHVRELDVPIDLAKVTWLDFCDEDGILALMTDSGPQHSEQRIHLLTHDLPAKFKKLLVPGKIQQVLCTGNVCDKETYEYLRTISADVHVVRGDYDETPFPFSQTIIHPSLRIGVIHGHQSVPVGDLDALNSVARTMDVDVLISGHTHKFEAVEFEGRFFLNPGSATGAWNGAATTDPTPSFALMDIQGPVVVTYVYSLIEGEVRVEKVEYRKPIEVASNKPVGGAIPPAQPSPRMEPPAVAGMGGSVW
ncbi:Vacuolar protein sorting-associated protein 29 [Tulasnella sp. 403]|nr:Vacuolar protein sorting-associated protein 29 [Tulasnella sp. 403]